MHGKSPNAQLKTLKTINRNMKYIAPAIAILLAIPTSGISIIVYSLWIYYKWNQKNSAIKYLNNLSKTEKAVLIVGTKHNNDETGITFEDISISDIKIWLTGRNIKYREYGYSEEQSKYNPIEFSLIIAGTKYDVDVHVNYNHPSEAIIRVRTSDPKRDELYEWISMTYMPKTICKWKLSDLKELNLGYRFWHEKSKKCDKPIPESIQLLRNLKVFSVTSERVTTLPSKIENLKELEEIRLERNNISSIPDSICQLKNLKILSIRKNDVERLPEPIGSIRTLEVLDISDNKIKSLPESIIELRSLKKLYMFDNYEMILSDRQIKWLILIIKNGTDVAMDAGTAKSLPITELPSGIVQIGDSVALS